MLKIKQLEHNQDIEGKRVLLRVDFNVPLDDGSITETSRIQKVLPTIRSLINKKAKIIIISHLGRPKGKIVPELSLKPLIELGIAYRLMIELQNDPEYSEKDPEEIIENSIAFKELGVSRLVASSYTNDLDDIFNNLDILAHHVMPNVK